MRDQTLSYSFLKWGTLAGLPLLLGTLIHCGSASDEASTKNVGMAGLALSGPINTDKKLPRYAVGTYTGCIGHSNGDFWAEPINGYVNAAPMTAPVYPRIKVVKNSDDLTCILKLQYFLFEDLITPGSVQFDAPLLGELVIGTSYQGTPVAFSDGLNANPDFYANAIRGTYANDFNVTIRYSSDINQVAVTKQSNYQAVSATVTASQVPAPTYDYLTSFDTVTVLVDANQDVLSVTGTASFTFTAGTAAQRYAINTTISGDPVNYDYAAVQAAFNAGSPTAFGGTLNLDASVPGADKFSLNGANIPIGGVVRYVILENLEATTQVASYQVIKITITPATTFGP